MELVSGRDARGLVDKVMAAETATDVFDARLQPACARTLERAVDVLEVAHRCVQPAPGDRPPMDAVCDLLAEAELAQAEGDGDVFVVDAEPSAPGDCDGAPIVQVVSVD